MGLFGFGKKRGEPDTGASSGGADVLKDLLDDCVTRDQPPAVPMEGCGPAFAHALSSTPRDFTFDAFIQLEQPQWLWRPVTLSEHFDGPFAFYQPGAWSDLRQEGQRATVGDDIAVRQSMFLLDSASAGKETFA